jgi:large subunit ribosomal protein L31
MREKIHPQNHKVKISCASCNFNFETLTTKNAKEIAVDICSHCHPFYIGSKNQVSAKNMSEKLASKFETGKARKVTKEDASKKVAKETKKKSVKSFEELSKLS